MSDAEAKVALILAGGAARGPYEVGVIDHVLHDVARDLGAPIPLDVLCGTSVGAINACMLAAYADDPRAGIEKLSETWRALRLEALLKPNTSELIGTLRSLVTLKRAPPLPGDTRRGGILDATGIERLVHDTIPFERISEHLRRGHLRALTVCTTEVATGRTILHVERARGAPVRPMRDPTILIADAAIGADHALASAAVPFLFPAVRLDGVFHCDGGLRQNVPLSPARRLGAERLLVVNPRYVGPTPPATALEAETSYPGPLFLLGKALNALLLDRIDNDIARLHRINDLLEAGVRLYGPSFLAELNRELGAETRIAELRPLHVVHVRASVDIGAAAGEYVRSPEFEARAPNVVGRLLRRIGAWDGAGEADLLSYLLFDGEFASRLIELGRKDAAARHDELCELFAPRVRAPFADADADA